MIKHILIRIDGNNLFQFICHTYEYLILIFLLIFLLEENVTRYIFQIKEFNSSFWIARQWFFDYKTVEGVYFNGVYFFSINPYR